MPIEFTLLPAFNKENVARKMKLNDFISFAQSSEATTSVVERTHFLVHKKVKNVEFKYSHEEISVRFLPSIEEESKILEAFGGKIMPSSLLKEPKWFKASEIPLIHFVEQRISIKSALCNSFCEKLINFFHRIGARNSTLVLSSCGVQECSSAILNELLNAADVTELRSQCESDRSLLHNLPEKISKIEMRSPVTDDDLRRIRAENIEIFGSQIGSMGLNIILKEWIHGERTINKIRIGTWMDLDASDILDGIQFEEDEDDSVLLLNNGRQRLYCDIDECGWFSIASEKK